MKKIASLFLLLVTVASCATKYQPYTYFSFTPGGYTDSQVGSDTFIVGYEGHAYSDMGTVHKYALIRAAELTQRNGFNYFIIITSQGFNSTSCRASTIGNTLFINKQSTPSVNITIKAFKEKPCADVFFTADEIIAQI